MTSCILSISKSIRLFIVSILVLCDVGPKTTNGGGKLFVSAATGSGNRRDTFTSFFEVEFETNFGTVQDLAQATQALVTSYNRKIQRGNYENPFDIQMEEVEVISTITNRRNLQVNVEDDHLSTDESSSSHRDLQRANFITVFLQGFGSCRGCRSSSRFTNDVSGRRSLQQQQQQGSHSHHDRHHEDEVSDKRDLRYFPSDGYSFGQRIGEHAPGSIGRTYVNQMQVQQQQPLGALPTEAEVLKEYSAMVRSLNLNNIVDVTNIDEIDELPKTSHGSKKSKSSSSGSKSSKASSSKLSSKLSKKGKGDQGGSKRSSSGSKRSNDDNSFTSFFQVVYETNFGTDKDVKDAAQGLVSVYNGLIGSCDDTYDISMDDIEVVQVITGEQERRSLVEPQLDEKGSTYTTPTNNVDQSNSNRDLQRRFRFLTVFLQGFGSCGRTCPSDSRFTNDVSGRRLEQQRKQIIMERNLRHTLHQYSNKNMFPMGVNPSIAATGGGGDSVSEDSIVTSNDSGVCSVPTEDELLAEYSAYIASRDYSNIVDVTALDEIDKLPSFDNRKNFDSTDSNDGRNSRKLKQRVSGSVKGGSSSYPKRGGKYKRMARTTSS